MSFETTDDQFEIFVCECKKWLDFLGIKGWRVEFYHEDWDPGSRANTRFSLMERIAMFNLGVEWSTENTDDKVMRSAFHEVMELFFGRFEMLARSRYLDESEIDEEKHHLIRTLENAIFEVSGDL